MKIPKQYIRENDRLPRFYGYAYSLIGYHTVVIYPIPLNYLVRWLRLFWMWLRVPSPLEFTPTKNYEAGYKEGFQSSKNVTTLEVTNVKKLLHEKEQQLDKVMNIINEWSKQVKQSLKQERKGFSTGLYMKDCWTQKKRLFEELKKYPIFPQEKELGRAPVQEYLKAKWEERADMILNVAPFYTAEGEKWHWKILEIKDFIRNTLKEFSDEIYSSFLKDGDQFANVGETRKQWEYSETRKIFRKWGVNETDV